MARRERVGPPNDPPAVDEEEEEQSEDDISVLDEICLLGRANDVIRLRVRRSPRATFCRHN